MRELSAKEVSELLQAAEAQPLLLDVREPWEYAICHIEGSEHVPMKSIPTKLASLDPERETVVICHHGIRSRMVGQYLQQEGFTKVINLSGGVKSWAQQVDASMPVY